MDKVYSLIEPFNYYNDKEYSNNNFISFWDEVSKKYVKWDKMYEKIWSGNEYKPEWFKDGLLNVCNNALDEHLKNENRRNQIALFHECPAVNLSSSITYYELWNKVCLFSRALKNLGIKKGDMVLIFMPTNIECAIAMLSCARIGAIHCVTYIAYNSKNLSTRINHSKPKVMITTNFGIKDNRYEHYIPTIKKALEISSHQLESIIMLDRIDLISKEKQIEYLEKNKVKDQGYQVLESTLDWAVLINNVEPLLEYELMNSIDPLYLLYTSGTTGNPKGVLVESGGFLVQSCYSYNNNYNILPGETFFTPSDIGWQLGHNLFYASLFIGSRFTLYEGDLFDPTLDYFRVIENTQAKLFLSVPTEFRTFQQIDPEAKEITKYNLSKLEAIILCGECLDSSIVNYINNKIGKPVIDNYGQSEAGWALCLTPSLPFRLYSCGKPVPGTNTVVISSETKECVSANEIGELLVKLPLPPCYAQTLILDVNQEEYSRKYLSEYPGYYRTGDLVKYDQDGYYYIISRVDDVINLGGDLIYNTLCEEIIQNNEMVSENVVVAIKDDYFGQVPIGVIILNQKFQSIYQENPTQFISTLKTKINLVLDESHFLPYSILKHLIIVSALPKTRSNKKIRNIISKIFDGEPYNVPPSMSNANILNNLENEINHFKLNFMNIRSN